MKAEQLSSLKSLLRSLAAIVPLLFFSWSTPASADGFYVPDRDLHLTEPSQKAVIVWDGKKETMIVSAMVQADAIANYAWIIPIDSAVKPDVAAGDIKVLKAFEGYFKKELLRPEVLPVTMMGYGPDGIEVLEVKEVDIYDVTILRATDTADLFQWLRENGYRAPEKSKPVLEKYINKAGSFFIINKIDLANKYRNEISEIDSLYAKHEMRRRDLCDAINAELQMHGIKGQVCRHDFRMGSFEIHDDIFDVIKGAIHSPDNPLGLPVRSSSDLGDGLRVEEHFGVHFDLSEDRLSLGPPPGNTSRATSIVRQGRLIEVMAYESSTPKPARVSYEAKAATQRLRSSGQLSEAELALVERYLDANPVDLLPVKDAQFFFARLGVLAKDINAAVGDKIRDLNNLIAHVGSWESIDSNLPLTAKIRILKNLEYYRIPQPMAKYKALSDTLQELRRGLGTPLQLSFQPPHPYFPLHISSLHTGQSRVEVYVVSERPVFDGNGLLSVEEVKVAEPSLQQEVGGAIDVGKEKFITMLSFHGDLGSLQADAIFKDAAAPAGLPGEPTRDFNLVAAGGSRFPPVYHPSRSTAAQFGDVDGDGDLDIFVANEYKQQNRLYLNKLREAEGRFVEATDKLPVDNDWSKDADFADVDGDGDLDIVIANALQDRLYLNKLSEVEGRFIDATEKLPLDGTFSNSVDFGDADGDGAPDMVIAKNGQNRLYLNRMRAAEGRFVDATDKLPTVNDTSTDAVFGDVDGDGDQDIVVANVDQPNRLYLNKLREAEGRFVDATDMLPAGRGASSYSVNLGDVDGDGDLDILLANGEEHWSRNRLYVNKLRETEGRFVDATDKLPAVNGRSADFGDVDGDGDLDIFIASAGGNHLCLNKLNEAEGRFVDATATLPPGKDRSADGDFGDVDGDGDLDIVVANDESSRERLYLNKLGEAEARFVDATDKLPADCDKSNDADFGDVDGDGDLDVIVANEGQNRLYLNKLKETERRFVDATDKLPSDSDRSNDADFGDVDGDGDPDVIVANAGRNRLYLNKLKEAESSFVDATEKLPPDEDVSNGVDFGDVDGDGDLDVIVANTGRDRLYLNKLKETQGRFVDATDKLPAHDGGSNDADFGDVDGDGDLDSFIAKAGQSRLYLNKLSESEGRFVDATDKLPVDTYYDYPKRRYPFSNHDADFGDVDGDGDLDIVVACAYQNRLYLNKLNELSKAAGHFVDASDKLPVDSDLSMDADFGDVDGDGDPDILVANSSLHANDTGQRAGRRNLLLINVALRDAAPPTVPTGLIVTTASCSGLVDLRWKATTDNEALDGYTIYRDGMSVGSSPTPWYTNTGLAEKTKYCYTVDAFDVAGNHSKKHPPVCETTPPCPGVAVHGK